MVTALVTGTGPVLSSSPANKATHNSPHRQQYQSNVILTHVQTKACIYFYKESEDDDVQQEGTTKSLHRPALKAVNDGSEPMPR